MDCDQGTWKTWRSFQLASFCAAGELEPHFVRGSGAGWACESKMPSQAWASGHLGSTQTSHLKLLIQSQFTPYRSLFEMKYSR